MGLAIRSVLLGAERAEEIQSKRSSHMPQELVEARKAVTSPSARERYRVIRRLAGIMSCNSQCGLCQQNCLMVLVSCLDDHEARREAGDMVNVITHAMHSFPERLRLQTAACGCLWRLTVGHSDEDDLCDHIARCKGIQLICKAMKDFPMQLELQRSACGAMRNLACNDDENKTRMVKAGGLVRVVTASKTFAGDAKMQEQALGCLKNLCDTVGRAAMCAKVGGVEAISVALKRHRHCEGVVIQGFMLLCMFCDEVQIMRKLLKSDVADVAVEVSKKQQGEPQQWASEFLRELRSKKPGRH